jgi:RNA polymerase sigma-70 factor (ECF subfamily)
MTELALVLAATRSGDAAAFEELMLRHERQVLITSLRLLGNLADAQDAAQEVFLRLYRHRSRVEEDRCGAWLYRVTVNVCRDLWKKRPTPGEDVEGLPAIGPDALERLAMSDRQKALALVLRRLPPKEREALVLHELEGLTTREVAEALGSSEATVRSHVSHARTKIREWLERRV